MTSPISLSPINPGRTLFRYLDLDQSGNSYENSKKFWREVCEWYKNQKNTSNEFKNSYDILDMLSDLSTLRNRVMHRLEGISIGEINEHFEQKHENIIPTLELFLRSVLSDRYFDKYVTNPYDKINEYILYELKSYGGTR